MRPQTLLAAAVAATVGFALAACGADDLEAPRPAVKTEAVQCRGFDQLMPRFLASMEAGKSEGLRRVIHDHLLVGNRPGDPAPIADVFRSVFATLNRFAKLPPELGAPEGQSCAATTAPPLEQSHPLCEMRRVMKTLVHEGKGRDAFVLTDPLVGGLLDYILGKTHSSATPHYEVATVLSHLCQQSAVCQLDDGLDLVIGLTAFAQTSDGSAALGRIGTLLGNPALVPYYTNDGQRYGGETGVIALVRFFLQIVTEMEDTSALDKLPMDQLPPELSGDAKLAIADLKKLLDPARKPNVFRPLKRTLGCYQLQDADLAMVRMMYRLGLVAKLPAFSLTRLVEALDGLRATDKRGSLLFLVRTLAEAVRSDEQAVDSAAQVCRTLFSTEVPAGQSLSNAQLALPVVDDLFSQGIAQEAVCAMDTLVYGCSGGEQPACGPSR